MENYIMINGKKIELSEETVKNIEKQFIPKKKSIFKKCEHNGKYYFVNTNGDVQMQTDKGGVCEKKRHENVNYNLDKDYLQNRTDREHLNRKLEKFSLENGGDEIDWNNQEQQKWNMYYDYAHGLIRYQYTTIYREPHNAYFISKEVCQQAIDKFGDEIKRLYGLQP